MDYNLTDLFDPSSLYFNGAIRLGVLPSAVNTFSSGVSPEQIVSGTLQGNTTVTDGYLKSQNYVAGVSGWKLTSTTTEFADIFGVRFSTMFETSTRFATGVSGSGAVTFGSTGTQLAMGATASSHALVRVPIGPANTQIYNQSPKFFFSIGIGTGTMNNATGWLVLGQPGISGSGTTDTDKHIGIKIGANAGNLYFAPSQADGTTNNLGPNFTNGVAGDQFEFLIGVNSSVGVIYRWRKNGGAWSSGTTLTGNVPSVTTSEFYATAAFSANGQSESNILHVYGFAYEILPA